ncbi:MAG: SPFH domain-containing protein [Candidatus Kariarchaeaceae archaeon]|jgi:flotillin
MVSWITGLKVGFTLFVIAIFTMMVIKSRYRRFTNREFVLRFRNGKLKNQGYGGGYFLLPLIDELIVLSTTVNNLEIDAGEVITSENQDVRVQGLVIWRVEDPVKAYQSIKGSQNKGVMTEINISLQRLVESIIRTTVARLSLDQVLRERSLIIEAIMAELLTVVGPMGIKINTAEIRHVDVINNELFSDLQEIYRQEARLSAEKVKIETNQEVKKSAAFAEQQIRLFAAEQQEKAGKRELEKDRVVLLEQQKLNETEELRLRSVQELQKKREASVAEIQRKKLQIEAETRLMEIEIAAESKKRKNILEDIEVQAQQKKLIAEADAEQRKVLAAAEAEAIKMSAQAQMEAVEMQANAEAYRLEKVADARKKSLLAEAAGKKAVLFAEAEGLREKVKAQGLVNDAMILQELVKQLPAIASSMKVGDINWLNMGGNGKNGDTPLGIIPKNLLQVMTLAKSFGLDIEGLVQSIRGEKPLTGVDKKLLAELKVKDINTISNAVAIDLNKDGNIDGFDLSGDGQIDFKVPAGVTALDLDGDGKIDGFDTSGDGKVDLKLEELLSA